MVKADIFWEKNQKNPDLYRNKDDFWKKLNKKSLSFNEKDFIFYTYICKMFILEDIRWNCKNLRFIYEQRRLLKKILIQKIIIF